MNGGKFMGKREGVDGWMETHGKEGKSGWMDGEREGVRLMREKEGVGGSGWAD